MKSMRSLQRNAIQQLFETRPALRQPFHRFQRPAQQSVRTRPSEKLPLTRSVHTQRHTNSASQAFRRRIPGGRRFNSTFSEPQENLTLSQRLKKLSREYGWAAFGVYMLLTALDFPFCFLAVRLIGTDRIGHWEHVILSYIKGAVKWPLPKEAQDEVDEAGAVMKEKLEIEESASKRVLEEKSEAYIVEDHGYKEAEQANRGDNASTFHTYVFSSFNVPKL